MDYFSYRDSPFPVRADIGAAHREFWRRLAGPGNWWSGAERVAIAAEARAARTCEYCRERKRALSAYTGEERHTAVSELPTRAIDAIHRIITDQNRITRSWVEDNAENGLTKPGYVELAGIVVALLSIDEFNRALGLPFEQLPEPQPGEPTRFLPPILSEDTGFVPMIPRGGASGDEADLFSGSRGANVLRALSLVPNALRDWKLLASAQYLSIEGMANLVGQDNRAIDRAQMEVVAGRVSAYNECFY